jgi:hypothetical protein
MTRRTLLFLPLGVLLVLLVWLVFVYQGSLLKAWRNEDYFYFQNSARAFLNDESPYAEWRLPYPLYTLLWLFIPLTLGDWTRWLWVFAPIIFLHLVLGRKAVVLWLFYPTLVHLRYGQVDGWLLVPIAWLLDGQNNLGSVGAALMLLKPQSAWALVAHRLIQWGRHFNWKPLAVCGSAAIILIVPAFLIRPSWVGEWLNAVMAYPWVDETLTVDVSHLQRCQNTTIWGWACFGSVGMILAILEGLLAGFLWWRSRFTPASTFLMGMVVSPFLFIYSQILIAPTLKTWRECIMLVLISWVAVAIDLAVGGWGGAYSIIPLMAMGILIRRNNVLTG